VHTEFVAHCYIHMNCIPARPVAKLIELYINCKFASSDIFEYISFIFIFRDTIYEYNVLNFYLYLGEVMVT
jgi:hypothetical protein